jgi:hypothetical protein
MKHKSLETFLISLLRKHTWNDEHEIIELNPGNFIVRFMHDADAEKFRQLMERRGATVSVHACH